MALTSAFSKVSQHKQAGMQGRACKWAVAPIPEHRSGVADRYVGTQLLATPAIRKHQWRPGVSDRTTTGTTVLPGLRHLNQGGIKRKESRRERWARMKTVLFVDSLLTRLTADADRSGSSVSCNNIDHDLSLQRSQHFANVTDTHRQAGEMDFITSQETCYLPSMSIIQTGSAPQMSPASFHQPTLQTRHWHPKAPYEGQKSPS